MTRNTSRIDDPVAFAAAFNVSRETIDRLIRYAELVQQWQKAVNLVAPATLDEIWHRHFADSAQLLVLAPRARNWLDLGSGAGFPGMVIAILLANRSDVSISLIESNARKCAFLNEIARETDTAVDIRCARIESLAGDDKLERTDIITSRALAPLTQLLTLSAPFFCSETKALFLKGRGVNEELTMARKVADFEAVLHQSMTDSDGRIVEIRNLEFKE